MEQQAAGADGSPGHLPIFYHGPRPLNAVADQGWSLQPITDFGFARATNSVLLGAAEFLHAMMHSYPIVFSGPLATRRGCILALENNNNLFLPEGGEWREGHYVPTYIRRYPFVFLERPEKNETRFLRRQGLMPADAIRRSSFIKGRGSRPNWYATPSHSARNFNEQTMTIAAFCRRVSRIGSFLYPIRLGSLLASGRQMILHGFQVVDEVKFNALADDVFIAWRRRWLPLVYCHLLSMQNWKVLSELASNK